MPPAAASEESDTHAFAPKAMAAAAGCDVADRVTKDTTILVIGDQDVRPLNGHEKSAKHLKAEKMIREGAMLRIIGETDFRALMSGT
jgi:DNA polymerase-3 subunit epsilon